MQKYYLLIVLLSIVQLVQGQETIEKAYPFSFEGAYTGDGYANATGGLQTGGGYMGMANMTIGFDTEKAGWWKGGNFFINGAGIHGRSLSEHELWFKQEFSTLSFTVGLQDLNAEFMVSENGSEFINSSFGVPPVISTNLPAPIFPLTGLGLTAQWNINEQFAWQAALFDGCQTAFDNNPYNLGWTLSKDDGALVMTELHSTFNINGLGGTYKLGAYYHSGLNEFDATSNTINTVFDNNYGFYFIGDQTVVEQDNRKLGLFAQVAIAPESKNDHAYYLGLGANYYGIFNKEGKDAMGLALAAVDIQNAGHNHETAVELYYKYQFNDNFALQPDVQYIINPSATGVALDNALVGMLRFHINF